MTDIVSPPTIASLSPAPLPTDPPAVFNPKAFELVADLDPMVTQVNSATEATFQNATAAQERAVLADTARADAVTAKDQAVTAKDDAVTAKYGAEDARDSALVAAAAAGAAAGLPSLVDNANKSLKVKADETGVEWGAGVDSINGNTGEVPLKTIGGASIVGSGDIPLSSGAMVYLGTVTAVNAASADITGLDTYGATYSRLVLICDRVNPNASPGTEIRAAARTNGIWQTSGHSFAYTTATATASPSSNQGTSSAHVTLCNQAGSGSPSPTVGYFARITINIPEPSTAGGTIFDWVSTGYDGTAQPNIVRGVGANVSDIGAPLQGLRIKSSTGNIWGIFRLYGVKNS